MTLQWLEREREREGKRGRSERNCGSVDKVKLKWSYLCLNITTICTTSIFETISIPLFFSPLLSDFAPFPLWTVSPLLHFFFLYYIFYLCFILECVQCSSLCSCHGKTERTKWWFIPAFPGPLQIVARLCFCFFFSSPFFSDTIFFQLGTRVCVWQVCHCGPLSLFVYHSWL